MGAAKGAQWLCREHPDSVRCDYVLNEGGGVAFEFDGRRFYTLCVGEKGVFRFLVADARPRRPRIDAGARRQRAARSWRRCSSGCARSPRRQTAEAIEFASALCREDIAADPDALDDARRALRATAPRGGRATSSSRCSA